MIARWLKPIRSWRYDYGEPSCQVSYADLKPLAQNTVDIFGSKGWTQKLASRLAHVGPVSLPRAGAVRWTLAAASEDLCAHSRACARACSASGG